MSETQSPVWLQFVLPAFTGAIGVLGTLVVSQYQAARTKRLDLAAKQAAVRLKYLDPLRLAGEDLIWKLHTIEGKIEGNEDNVGGLKWMLRMFHCVKEPQEILGRTPSETEHGFWCNGEGYFAIATIYATACFFLHAKRARREYLDDNELIRKLDDCRVAFGHEYGIYIMLQDSIGEYVSNDTGTELGFRSFCTKMYREEERLWLLNVMDYYRDIAKKSLRQRQQILSSLLSLLEYLEQATGIAVYTPPELAPADQKSAD